MHILFVSYTVTQPLHSLSSAYLICILHSDTGNTGAPCCAARSRACPGLCHRPNNPCSGEQGTGLPVPFPCAPARGVTKVKKKKINLQASCGDAPSSSSAASAPHFLFISVQLPPCAACSSLGHTHCRHPVTCRVCCVPGWGSAPAWAPSLPV